MVTRDDQGASLEKRPGWLQYLDVQVPDQPVLIRFGNAATIAYADCGGYIDIQMEAHNHPPGWRAATAQVIEARDLAASGITTASELVKQGRTSRVRLGKPVPIPVRVIGDQEKVGLISDVDDSIVITQVPRPLLAARNAFITKPSDRRPVPGMARLLQRLRVEALRAAGTHVRGWPSTRAHRTINSIAAPMAYLSTGAWATAPTLRRYLRTGGFPLGTVILRPWGLSSVGLPPGGIEHKLGQFARLTQTIPHVKWILLGDDGQHDPAIFTTLAQTYPDRVAAIIIRTLSPAEHLLSHGSPTPKVQVGDIPRQIPVVHGEDGHSLLSQVKTSAFRDQLARVLA